MAEPWKTAKTDPGRCEATIHCCLQLTDTLRVLFSPFIPFSCDRIGKMLGRSSQDWSDAGKECLEAGSVLGSPEILFAKLDEGFESVFDSDEGTPSAEADPPAGGLVSFDDFKKLDLRAGVITGVFEVEGADRLYRLTVDVGTETREMIAGLRPWYEPGELTGRRAVVVCNLEPAVIRGVKSNGMILASDGDKGVFLVEPGPDAAPGDRVR
jgi:methionyl-tRNA synthetase